MRKVFMESPDHPNFPYRKAKKKKKKKKKNAHTQNFSYELRFTLVLQ